MRVALLEGNGSVGSASREMLAVRVGSATGWSLRAQRCVKCLSSCSRTSSWKSLIRSGYHIGAIMRPGFDCSVKMTRRCRYRRKSLWWSLRPIASCPDASKSP